MPKTKHKLFIGADHRGFQIKEELEQILGSTYELVDLGANHYDKTDDYPDIAVTVAEAVASEDSDVTAGILICGSGIGVAQAAGKVRGIRVASVDSLEDAILDRKEHDSNVLTFGADTGLTAPEIAEISRGWLEAEFAGGRHLRRINKVLWYELKHSFPISLPVPVPTILTDSSDLAAEQFAAAKDYAKIINFDYIEPEFAGTKTIALEEIMHYIKSTSKLCSLHLMMRDPLPVLKAITDTDNLLLVYVHVESNQIAEIATKEWSFILGLAVNPETQIETLELKPVWEVIQLMTVTPGKQGQPFKSEVLEKIPQLRTKGFQGAIHLDGGINDQTIQPVLSKYSSEIEVLNIGSGLVKAKNPRAAYANYVDLISNFNLA